MEKHKIRFVEKVANKLSFYAIDFGVDLFIACQFALESDYGRSRLATEQFNFCGMKSPKKRLTVDIYPGSVFATYGSLDECILDYVIWLSWNHFTMFELQDVSLFIKHLEKSGYCPEKDYINKIQSIYSQFKSIKNV